MNLGAYLSSSCLYRLLEMNLCGVSRSYFVNFMKFISIFLDNSLIDMAQI
jgi:hypothetical protein